MALTPSIGSTALARRRLGAVNLGTQAATVANIGGDIASGNITGALQQAGGDVLSLFHIGGGSGSTVASPSSPSDFARKARADSYLLGAVNGSVACAQLAMGAKQTNTAASEQAYYTTILNEIQAQAPGIWAEASANGPLHDSANGTQGLAELSRLGVGFNEQGMGNSTTDGSAPTDYQTQQLVIQVRNLAITTGVKPGTSLAAGGVTGALAGFTGTTGLLLIVGIIGALLLTRGRPAGRPAPTYSENPRRSHRHRKNRKARRKRHAR